MQNSIASSSTSNNQLENTMGVSRQRDRDNNNHKNTWGALAQRGGSQEIHSFEVFNCEISWLDKMGKLVMFKHGKIE